MLELMKRPIWVCWNREMRDGRETKIPKNAVLGGNARTNDSSTWCKFQAAQNFSSEFSGIGFVFHDGVCGIDIDDCRDREGFAEGIIDLMDSYTERSPSGNGYHIIFKCDTSRIPSNYRQAFYQKNPHNGTECYISGFTHRFFTYTGDIVRQRPVEDRTDKLLQFLESYMRRDSVRDTFNVENSGSSGSSDSSGKRDILEVARRSRNGAKFSALYDRGDTSGYGGDDSAADMALSCILAFYCGADPAEIDRLFRRSALYRQKWERADYRDGVITKAIAMCGGEFYGSRKRRKAGGASGAEGGASGASGASGGASGASGGGKEPQPLFTLKILREYLAERDIGLKQNVITRRTEIDANFDNKYSAEYAEDLLPTQIYDELKSEYSRCSKSDVADYLNAIARENSYNPVADMIDAIKWDGNSRFNELFEILGIEDDDIGRTLVFKWLWQCASICRNEVGARAFGADGVLCFVGPQGVGKTSFFRHLAVKREFFGEGAHLNFQDKDTLRRAGSAWITELGEIESTFKSNVPKLKAFITDPADTYRLPYGRGDVHLARRTSFCATCNSDDFLIDPTGNRRFWTVPVKSIDLERLSNFDARQLWAEVEWIACDDRQGFRLTEKERKQLSSRNISHERPLKAEPEVRDILEMAKSRSDMEYRRVTVSEFKQSHDILKSYSVQSIGTALTKMGIECAREKEEGRTYRRRELPVLKLSRFGLFGSGDNG